MAIECASLHLPPFRMESKLRALTSEKVLSGAEKGHPAPSLKSSQKGRIAEFKERLVQRARVLLPEVNAPLPTSGRSDVDQQDGAEQEASLEAELKGLHSQELVEIDEALARIMEETYGQCVECGVEIPMERLRELPYAKCCVQCQDNLERSAPSEGIRKRPKTHSWMLYES